MLQKWFQTVWIYVVLLLCFVNTPVIGGGFYGTPNDQVTELLPGTYQDFLHKNDKGIFLEFYSQYCGHCKAFKPEFIRLSNALKLWRPLVVFAGLHCSDFPKICSDYKVRGYPTLYYIPPHAKDLEAFIEFTERRSRAAITSFIADQIDYKPATLFTTPVKENIDNFRNGKLVYGALVIVLEPSDNLPYQVAVECAMIGKRICAVANVKAEEVDYVKKELNIGKPITIKKSMVSDTRVIILTKDSEKIYDSKKVVQQEKLSEILQSIDPPPNPPPAEEEDNQTNEEEDNQTNEEEKQDPDPEKEKELDDERQEEERQEDERKKQEERRKEEERLEEERNKQQEQQQENENKVDPPMTPTSDGNGESANKPRIFAIDSGSTEAMVLSDAGNRYDLLEVISSLYFLINFEIMAIHNVLEPDACIILAKFINGISRLFINIPTIYNNLINYSKEISIQCNDKDFSVSTVAKIWPSALPIGNKWNTCKGSDDTYRGFPCSLWLTFHLLSINCDPNGVEFIIFGDPVKMCGGGFIVFLRHFIENFFGCAYCRDHFVSYVDGEEREFFLSMDKKESILWLWKTHNGVNKRLQNDKSTDPAHPKLQFPPMAKCPSCRDTISNDSNLDSSPTILWHKETTYQFLLAWYDVNTLTQSYGSLMFFNYTHIALVILVMVVLFRFAKKRGRLGGAHFYRNIITK